MLTIIFRKRAHWPVCGLTGAKRFLIGEAGTSPGQASILSGTAVGLLAASMRGECLPFSEGRCCFMPLFPGGPVVARPYIIGFGALGGAQHIADCMWEDYKVL